MITEALINVFTTVIAWLISLLPSWTPPGWLATVIDTLTDAMGYVGMLAGWVPVKAIGTVVVFLLACSTVAFGVKAGRMVLSLFTGGGGSAA